MKRKEVPPTIKEDHPLQKGSRWLWVPAAAATGAAIIVQLVLFMIQKGC